MINKKYEKINIKINYLFLIVEHFKILIMFMKIPLWNITSNKFYLIDIERIYFNHQMIVFINTNRTRKG